MSMVVASTKNGYSVKAFPDVCHVPTQPSPLPIPYPVIGVQSQIKAIKGRDATGKAVIKGSTLTQSSGSSISAHTGTLRTGTTHLTNHSFSVPSEGANVVRLGNPVMTNTPRVGQLRTRLQAITSQLVSMPAGNADVWHQLVDEYVVVSAELFLEMSSD